MKVPAHSGFISRSRARWKALAAAFYCALCLPLSAAVIELFDGGKLEGTPTFALDGRISVTTTSGEPHQLSWERVRAARLKAADIELKPLPKGWHSEEIGRLSASSSEKNGQFTFSVENGELKNGKYPSVHFASRILRGEPIVSTRLLDFSGARPAVGGVMLREGMELTSAYIVLGVTAERKLRLETRESGWAQVKSVDLGAVSQPVWLRLSRVEKDGAVTAWRSADGKTWQQIGQSRISTHSEPYPPNSDQWKPRLYAGIGIIAPTNGSKARLQVDHSEVAVRGLLGEYFADRDLASLAFTRPDRQIDFSWNDRSPAPQLEADNFSVRWRGAIEAKHSEPYRFYFEPGGTRLWVDGQELPPLKWEDRRRNEPLPKEIPLFAGRKYDIQFEFRRNAEARVARLGWASRSQAREIINNMSLSYTFGPESPDEQSSGSNVFHAAGVWLRSGTFLAGDVNSASSSATHLGFSSGKPLTILNSRIARVILRSNRRPLNFDLSAGRTGIFLQSGDFLESELDAVNERSVLTSSVLFGRRSYSRDSSQVLAIVFNGESRAAVPFEVELVDGSIIRARKVQTRAASLVMDEVALGELVVPINSVEEIRNPARPTRQASAR